MNNKYKVNKNKYFKISLASLSLAATLSIIIQNHVRAANNNPIINPTNPSQVIIPKQGNYNVTPVQASTNSNLEQEASHDFKDEKVITEDSVVESGKINSIGTAYQYKTKRQTQKKQVDKYYSPAVLPTYHFDIIAGGNDDVAIPSETGRIMASMCGTMLIGI